MKKNHKEFHGGSGKFLATLLAIAMSLSLMPLAAFAEGGINEGEIQVNDGDIDYNIGSITTNNGAVAYNVKDDEAGYGGKIATNAASGTIGVNEGEVGTNEGSIGLNIERVVANIKTVTTNTGVIDVNAEGATVDTNGYGVWVDAYEQAAGDKTYLVIEDADLQYWATQDDEMVDVYSRVDGGIFWQFGKNGYQYALTRSQADGQMYYTACKGPNGTVWKVGESGWVEVANEQELALYDSLFLGDDKYPEYALQAHAMTGEIDTNNGTVNNNYSNVGVNNGTVTNVVSDEPPLPTIYDLYFKTIDQETLEKYGYSIDLDSGNVTDAEGNPVSADKLAEIAVSGKVVNNMEGGTVNGGIVENNWGGTVNGEANIYNDYRKVIVIKADGLELNGADNLGEKDTYNQITGSTGTMWTDVSSSIRLVVEGVKAGCVATASAQSADGSALDGVTTQCHKEGSYWVVIVSGIQQNATLNIGSEACTHSWNAGVVVKNPTIDEAGLRTYTCAICGETKGEPIEKIASGAIVFDFNYGNADGATTVVERHAIGETIVMPTAPVREGYEFLYWKGSEYQPGDTYTVEGDHTFVAQWKVVGTNDGEGASSAEEPAVDEKAAANEKVAFVTEPVPAREATSANPESSSQLPKTGDQVTIVLFCLTACAALSGASIVLLRQLRRQWL